MVSDADRSAIIKAGKEMELTGKDLREYVQEETKRLEAIERQERVDARQDQKDADERALRIEELRLQERREEDERNVRKLKRDAEEKKEKIDAAERKLKSDREYELEKLRIDKGLTSSVKDDKLLEAIGKIKTPTTFTRPPK